MKTGLIMEGGAMRGMFTCGVIDVMQEAGITFDGAIGVSAGAVLGCNYKSEQIGRAYRYTRQYCKDYRYGSMKSFRKTGNAYDVDFCYHEIPEKLDVFDKEAFKANPMIFYAVATDVVTGKAVYHKCSDGEREDIEWLRASASMPLVSKVVNINGHNLLDGGIGDSIPLKFMEEQGFDRNVVILTQPLHYVKQKNKFMPIAKIFLHRYPNMVKSMGDRHFRYNDTISYIESREKEGKVLVIRPPEALNIGSMETRTEEIDRVYMIGRETGLGYVELIKDFLKKDIFAGNKLS